jgi:hypothetical protein
MNSEYIEITVHSNAISYYKKSMDKREAIRHDDKDCVVTRIARLGFLNFHRVEMCVIKLVGFPSKEEPPIGIMPSHIFNANRVIEIAEAIGRYSLAGKSIPNEWLDELRNLNEEK